jgi:hypothetical protein
LIWTTNTAYTWYESTSTWVNRGSDTVSVATNTALGVVKGDASTPGKIYAETDGSQSVNGWDNLITLVNGMKSVLDGMSALKFRNSRKAARGQTMDTSWRLSL